MKTKKFAFELDIAPKAQYNIVKEVTKLKNAKRAYPKISLKAARVNAGLHQREAAKALGINVATLQHYENGKTVPDVLLLPKIESVYKFPADYIFFGRDCALSESTYRKSTSANSGT